MCGKSDKPLHGQGAGAGAGGRMSSFHREGEYQGVTATWSTGTEGGESRATIAQDGQADGACHLFDQEGRGQSWSLVVMPDNFRNTGSGNLVAM